MTMSRVRSLSDASDPIPVVAEMRRGERNVDAAPAREPHGGVVGVIGGVENDGFVAGATTAWMAE